MTNRNGVQLVIRWLPGYLLSLLLCGLISCATAARKEVDVATAPAATTTATRIAPPRTPSPPAETPPGSKVAPLQVEPTATSTITPPTLTPTAKPIPTSSVVPGWLTYENEFLGYSFSYPLEARIRAQGVTGFPTDELPENVTAEEYQAELEAKYPDDLCITVTYKTTFVTFVPSDDSVGKYTVPCGVTGVGDYDVESNIESLIIGNVQMVGDAFWLSERDSGAWHGEFTMLNPHDNIGIHFGSLSGTQEEFLQARETMMQIVFSFRQE
jgi:hypothetical protein